MRKMFLLFVLVFCGCLCSYGQDIKKELKIEEDGFKWYRITHNGLDGAETTAGKTIIPLSKKYVSVQYHSPYLMGLYHSDKPGVILKIEYYTKEGKEILDNSKYDDTCLLGGEDGTPYWFLTAKDGKNGACDANGNEIVPPIFDSCFYSEGEFNIKDATGYHKWSEYCANSKKTYSTRSNISNQKANIKEMFDLAYNTPYTEAQTKYDRYVLVIRADPYNSYGYKAAAYNNIGVLYEKLGDLKKAKAYYEYALQANPNYGQAKSNLKNVKAQRRSQRWNNISNALDAVGQALGTMSGGQTNGTGNSYQGTSGSYSGTSTSGKDWKNCHSCGGSGLCKSCKGTGLDAYTKSGNCGVCHGSRKCAGCRGDGGYFY